MTKDYLIIERSDIGRAVTDVEWKALRDWVTRMAKDAIDAITFYDVQGVDEWVICSHGTLTAPFQSSLDCYRCELETEKKGK